MDSWLDFILFIAVLVGGQFVAIALHELGHAVAAWACQWKLLVLKVGGGPVLFSFMWRDLQFCWSPWPISGLVRAHTSTRTFFRLKQFLFYAGGPLASCAVLVGTIHLFSRLPEWAPEWLTFGLGNLVFLQIALLAGSLIPHQAKVDGEFLSNDMLGMWRTAFLKKQDVNHHVLGTAIGAGKIYLERKQVDRAQTLVESVAMQILELKRVSARILWVHVLLTLGRKSEADQTKAHLVANKHAMDMSSAEVLDSLACLPLFYGHDDLVEEGLRHIDAAIALEPESITLKGTKGALLVENGQVSEALELIEEVAHRSQSENDHAISSYYRALAYFKMDQRTEARHLLREAIEKYPQCVVRIRIEKIFWNDPQ
jgi:tetratricopeptide (TPR) repeat protein